MHHQPSDAPRAWCLAVGWTLSLSSSALWGWVSESLLVTGLTLVCASAQVLLGPRNPSPDLAEAARLYGTGAWWTAIERLWSRFGIGEWGRL